MVNFVAYGICPNSPADFKVVSECAILNGAMSFVNAQNHALMGQGAEITYDTTRTVYVVAKISETEWLVRNGDGGVPVNTIGNVTCNTITHPFASQGAFEAGIAGILGSADLTAAEMNVHGVCYCEQATFVVDAVPVTYDGTTCDENYQLYIYTPFDTVRQCNFSHRLLNGGAWNAQLYRIEVAGAVVATSNAVTQFINFCGLQFHMSSAAGAHITAIYLFGTLDSMITIDSSVIRVADVNANWLRTAVRCDQGGSVVSNCIIYLIGLNAIQVDFQGLIADADSTMDLRYCTIYGWRTPISEGGAAVVTAQNNAIIGNSVVASSLTTQDYNVYDINEGEVHGYLTAQADNALFAAVGGGRETWVWTPVVGSDLIFRAKHFNNYTHDLDHVPGWRSQGIAPCAGALELEQCTSPFGICPNCPADFQTGAGQVTLVDSLATFEVPQIHNLMGVGADVDYGAGPAHGYVKEMVNPFEFVLRTGAGAWPGDAANQAVNNIDHPFASQSAAEAGYAALTGNASLVAGNDQLWLPCYCEQATYLQDSVAVTYDGITCDWGHWVKTFSPFSTVKESIMQHRNCNRGIWDDTRYRLNVNGNDTMTLQDAGGTVLFLELIGLQIRNRRAGTAASRMFNYRCLAGAMFRLCECILSMVAWSNLAKRYFRTYDNDGRVLQFFNNVFSYSEISAIRGGHDVFLFGQKDVVQIYQNVFYAGEQVIWDNANSDVTLINNAWVYNETANVGVDRSDYNLYREIDGGDANGVLTTQNDGALWETIAAIIEDSDWCPRPGSDLIDRGMVGPTEAVDFAFMLQGDLDHPFETEWRPQGIPTGPLYDIGPLERKYAGLVQWYNYW